MGLTESEAIQRIDVHIHVLRIDFVGHKDDGLIDFAQLGGDFEVGSGRPFAGIDHE